jgi:hypothetical protein
MRDEGWRFDLFSILLFMDLVRGEILLDIIR